MPVKLFIDLDARRFVESSLSTSPADLSGLFRGDVDEYAIYFLERSNNSATPYVFVDKTDADVKLAIGDKTGTPTSGTWTLNGEDLDWDASVVDVQEALQTSLVDNDLEVVGSMEEGFTVTFGTTGAKSLLTGDVSGLLPGCDLSITERRAGTASVKEQQFIRVRLSPAAYCDDFSEGGTSISATITEVVAGTSTANEVQKIALNTEPASGDFTITIPSDSRSVTAAVVGGLFTTTTNHGFVVGQPIVMTGFTGEANFTEGTTYYVQSVPTRTTYTIAATSGGAAITTATASAGAGTVMTFARTTEPMDYDASPSEVQSALQELDCIGSGGVTVTGQTGGYYQLQYAGDKGLAAFPAVTAQVGALLAAPSRVGTVNLATYQMDDLIGSSLSAELVLEVQLYEDSLTTTVASADVFVSADLIDGATLTPVAQYVPGATGVEILQAETADDAARAIGFEDVLIRAHHCSPGTGSGGYNELFISLSADGKRFTTISTRLPSTHPLYVRDPSMIRYGDTWVVAHTVSFDGTKTFGMATSTDLHNWTSLGSITVPGISGTPNNTWAPEWVIYNGEYYLVLRVSTQSGNYYGTPGPGYIKCTNPGTWTNWTDFTALGGISTDWNDCFILERNGTWRIVAVDLDAGAGGGSKMVTATSGSPFSGYGTATQIDASWKTQIGSGSYFEGPNIIYLGGDNYRLYVQHGNTDKTYFVDSSDGMATWGATLTEIGFDGPEGYFSGHGTALRVAKNDFLQAVLKSSQVAKEQTKIAYLGRTAITPAGKPSFDIATGVTIPQVTLTSLTSSSTTATATKTAHGFSSGQRIMISGANQSEYNGEYAITVTSADTFTYAFAGSGTTPATGTIVAANHWIRLNTPIDSQYAKNGRIDLNVSAAGSDDMVSLDVSFGAGAGTVQVGSRYGYGWVTRARVSYGSNTAQVDIRVNDITRTYSVAGQYVPYSGTAMTLDIANAATPLATVSNSASCYLPGRWEGTIDPGSIAAGAYGTISTANDVLQRSSITVDPYWNPAVAVSFYSTPTAGLLFTDAYVGTSGQITFRFYNATGSPIDNGAMRVSAVVNF